MSAVRRRVRLWAVTCLLLQAAGLTAFVPRDCCAAHKHAGHHRAAADEHQHAHHAPPISDCPMHEAGGVICPMHRTTAATGPEPTPAPAPDCVMRGMCNGPPLFTLLPAPAILPPAESLPVPTASAHAPAELREDPGSRLGPPDSPPPRA